MENQTKIFCTTCKILKPSHAYYPKRKSCKTCVILKALDKYHQKDKKEKVKRVPRKKYFTSEMTTEVISSAIKENNLFSEVLEQIYKHFEENDKVNHFREYLINLGYEH